VRTGVVLAIIILAVLLLLFLFAASGRSGGGGGGGWRPSPSCTPSVRVYTVNARVYPQGYYDLSFYAESGSRIVVDLSIRDEPLPRNNDVRIILWSPSGNVVADVVARGHYLYEFYAYESGTYYLRLDNTRSVVTAKVVTGEVRVEKSC